MLLVTFLALVPVQGTPQSPAVPLPAAKSEHAPVEAGSTLRHRREDRLYFDTSAAGGIWVRGRDYKARFDADGLEFHPFLGSNAPRNYPLGLTLKSARVGAESIDLSPAGVSREGDDVVVQRSGLQERYHVKLDSVEQTFVLEHLSSRQELALELAITTDLVPEHREDGFAFLNDLGGVHVTQAVVFDADGRSLGFEMELGEGALRLVVPESFLEQARLPITIDPVVTTIRPDTSGVEVRASDVASVSNLVRFMVWEETFSATDHDIYMAKIQAQLFGGFGINGSAGLYIDNTSGDWREPAMAYNVNTGSLLVAAERRFQGSNTAIWARVRVADSNVLGAQNSIATSSSQSFSLPDVGGNSSFNGANLFAVAYESTAAFTGYNILVTTVSPLGIPVSQLAVATSLEDERHPSISKTSGFGLSANQAWNLAWDRGVPSNHDIWGARIGPTGNFVDAPFPIDLGPDDTEFPSASSSLVSPTVNASWMCAYINNDGTGGTRDMQAAILRGSLVQGGQDLTALVSTDPTEDASFVDVDSDGCRYVVAWNETWNNSLDLDVHVATIAPLFFGLKLDERRTLATTTDLEWMPSVAAVWDDTGEGSDAYTISWEGFLNGPPVNSIVEVAVYVGPDTPSCLTKSVCSANANSTGHPAQLMAYGDSSFASNSVGFTVMGLPPSQFGYMLMSNSTSSVALSQGVLCLGAPQIRFNDFVLQSGWQGTVFFGADLVNLPQGSVITLGSTWYFQYWYRDANPQPVSNLSDAIQLDFE